jgi:WD40 repeat protein
MFGSTSTFGQRSGGFFGQNTSNTLGSTSGFGSNTMSTTNTFGPTTVQNPSNPNNDIEIQQAPDDTIQALKFNPQVQGTGIFLAAGSWDFTCRVWQINENGSAEAKGMQNVGAPVLGIDWFNVSVFTLFLLDLKFNERGNVYNYV